MEKIIVESSARHIHLTQEQIEILCGKGHQLTVKKELSQPGQFVCEERIRVVGPKGELKCSILGPARKAAQVELSLTDARTIGVEAAIRESGDIEGTAGVHLIGPEGEMDIDCGVIAAKRHIHMTNADAEKYGVKSGDVVSVKVDTDGRALTFGDVVVRVRDDFALAMHIDTDEANACGLKGSAMGEIIK